MLLQSSLAYIVCVQSVLLCQRYIIIVTLYCTLGVDGSQKCVYLAGNSLGLEPIDVKQLVLEELEKWKNKLAKCMIIL